jgi:RimJ/RimL family protein N-acetyltransferase
VDGVIFLSPDIPASARDWRNYAGIWRWCRQHTLLDAKSHERWLERISTDPSIKMFGIEVEDGQGDRLPVGVCGLTSIDHLNQKAEFSLYISPGHQGSGLGKLALRTLLSHGFKDFNLNRIWGETYEGNPALTMFEKLGFTIEGKQRQAYFRDGKFIDSFIVSMLREEFK